MNIEQFLTEHPLQASDFNPVYWKSFKGIADLYGISNLFKFATSQVIVIGVGGVGSWAVESLARTGIGSLTLIDADDVCSSNINRQLVALHSTTGDDKVDVLTERCQDINPCSLNILTHSLFLTDQNLKQLIQPHFYSHKIFAEDSPYAQFNEQEPTSLYVIDAIDNAVIKAQLINYCRQNKYKLVVCGAAGGKTRPELIQLKDLTETVQDPLIANIRNKLRRDFGYKERFKDKKFGVPTVFSSEQLKVPNNVSACDLKGLNCSNGYGSSVVVTATFANYAVSRILKYIMDAKS